MDRTDLLPWGAIASVQYVKGKVSRKSLETTARAGKNES